MTATKKGFYGVLFALSMLCASVSQFGIVSLIRAATGWKCPTWLAWVVYGLAAVAAIISVVASAGVTLPTWLAIAVNAAKAVSA